MTRRPSITSTHNERLKAVRRLRRRRGELFVVDGGRQLRCALDGGARVREVYIAPSLFLGPDDLALAAQAERGGARVVELGASAFASISASVRPDGFVAAVERWPTGLAQLRDPSLLLVADGVERPGNLGTIVRTACAAGADGLLVCGPRVDVFHGETVRASVGTIFHLPIARAGAAEAIAWLRERGFRIVVATPNGRRCYSNRVYVRPLALVVGNERYGVGDAWREAADETVRIPLPGPADSLNVAVAAGVVLFEAVRPL